MTRITILLASFAVGVAGTAQAQHEHGHGAGASRGGDASAAAPANEAGPAARPAGRREWTRYPLLLPAMGGEGDRGAARLRLVGIEAASVAVYPPNGAAEGRHATAAVSEGVAAISPPDPKAGNYHWLIARSEQTQGDGTEVRVASSAWFFANPGSAPTAMLKQSRHELEIIPDPLPREHGAYRESEKWNFLVRFEGRPLSAQLLTLETEFGTRTTFLTDSRGMATVLFPRDFKPAPAGAGEGRHGGARRARFVLGTEYARENKRYVTAFNLTYAADPDRERSVPLGVAFGALGMVAAVPLLRRRRAAEAAKEES